MALPFTMEIDQAENGIEVIRVDGELDHSTAPVLARHLQRAVDEARSGVLLDLSGCPFADSTALGVIVHAQENLVGAGGRLVLCGGSESIRRVLDLTELNAVLAMHEGRSDALAALAS